MAVSYIDTSALIKRYRTEEGSTAMASVFEAKRRGDTFFTSELTTLEISSATARIRKAGLISQNTQNEILRAHGRDIDRNIIALPVNPAVIADASAVTIEHALRVADAIHLAAAVRVKNIVGEQVKLVTSDAEVVQAGCEIGLVVLDPVAEEAS